MRGVKVLWATYYYVLFVLFFLLFYPVFIYLLKGVKNYPAAHKLRGVWGRILFVLCGFRPQLIQEGVIEWDKTYVVVSNHSSYLDIPALNVALPLFFSFLAKDELAKIPLFGIFFRTLDVAVDRRTKKGALKAIKDAQVRLQKGNSLAIFPEGTIPTHLPNMKKFKSGAFRLAIESGVPILPVSMPDNWKRMPDNGWKLGAVPGKMRVFVHRPIQTSNLTEVEVSELQNKVFNIIETKILEVNNVLPKSARSNSVDL